MRKFRIAVNLKGPSTFQSELEHAFSIPTKLSQTLLIVADGAFSEVT
jgi:hypothetical protein